MGRLSVPFLAHVRGAGQTPQVGVCCPPFFTRRVCCIRVTTVHAAPVRHARLGYEFPPLSGPAGFLRAGCAQNGLQRQFFHLSKY